MKIALLTLNYLPSTGGLVSYVRNFAKYLLDAGHEVDIYCSHEKVSKYSDVEEFERATIHRVDALNVPWILKAFTPFYVSKKFRGYLCRRLTELKQYDLIVVRHIYLAYALKNLGVNYIFLSPLISPKLILINAKKQTLIKRLYSYLITPQLWFIEAKVANSAKIAVLSNSKAVEIKSYFRLKEKPAVIYPGINEERFNLKGRTVKQSLENVPLRVISVCRLVEEKNLDLVIEAIADLMNLYGVPISYSIVGDGPLLNDLKSRAESLNISNNINFAGYSPEPEIYLKANELFIMPSTYEGFGHVYLEANACGLPVIAISSTAKGVTVASNEIITNDINGFIMSQNTKEDLIDAILKYISVRNNEDWEGKCSDIVNERFSWAAHLKNLSRVNKDAG